MKIHFILAFMLIAQIVLPARAADPAPLPPDLAAVPANAICFIHIRVADVWKSDVMKDFRETVLKAGAKALDWFDTRFLPAPSSVERFTITTIPRDPENMNKLDCHFLGILAFNKPFDREALIKSSFPKAVEQKTTNGSYFADKTSNLAVFFVNDTVIVFGQIRGIKEFVDQRTKPNTQMIDALHAANSKRHLTVAANFTTIPDDLLANIPGEVRPLLAAKLAIASLDVAENSRIDIRLRFGDAKACAAADAALHNLTKKGKSEIAKLREQMLKKVLGDGKTAPIEELPETALALIALGSFERMDEILTNPPIKREGNNLQAAIKFPNGPEVIGLTAMGSAFVMPAVQMAREEAARVKSANNLKQIGIALHTYHNDYGVFPDAAICDKAGKPLLSWRVALLPYLDEKALYEKFKLDEPWNSDNNKKLIPLMPKVYLHPDVPPKEPGVSHYRIFYGDGVIFNLQQSLSLAQITDGTSHTLMAFEAEQGVTWTKSEEFKYEPEKPLPKFGASAAVGSHILFADGSVHFFLKGKLREKYLRSIITAAGGEVVEFP